MFDKVKVNISIVSKTFIDLPSDYLFKYQWQFTPPRISKQILRCGRTKEWDIIMVKQVKQKRIQQKEQNKWGLIYQNVIISTTDGISSKNFSTNYLSYELNIVTVNW